MGQFGRIPSLGALDPSVFGNMFYIGLTRPAAVGVTHLGVEHVGGSTSHMHWYRVGQGLQSKYTAS